MYTRMPLKFVNLQFHDCYYVLRESDPPPEKIESSFENSFIYCQPLKADPSRGEVLRVQEWTSHRKPELPPDSYLVQVLHMMPAVIQGYGVPTKKAFVHCLVVKVWGVRPDYSFMGMYGKGRSHLEPVPDLRQLTLILNRPISHGVLHLYKKGHLGFMIDPFTLKELVTLSKLITKSLDSLACFYTIWNGLNEPEAIKNCEDHHQANSHLHVFSFFDSCFATISPASTEPALQDVDVILTSDLLMLTCFDVNGRPAD